MKHIVLDALNQFKLDDKLPHTDQDAEKWDSLVQKVVENEGALNAFVDFWPIKAYFDFYTTYKARALGRTPRKRKKRSDIPEHMRVQSTRIVKYVGLRPPSSEHFADPPSRSYGSQRHKKLQRQRSPSIVWVSPGAPSPSPAPYYLAFESAFDKEVRQPCWVCRSVPEALHAYRLRELFQNDSLCKQELSIKIGLRCDLDLDTLLSLNRPTRDELFRETEMNTTLVQRINKILASEKPQAHAILNIAECDFRRYIAKVYPCKEHPALSPKTDVPPHLLERFNRVRLDHLLPAVFLPLQYREQLSSLHKAALLWALCSE